MLDENFCRTASEAARAAGEVLQQWADKFTVREKGPANLVTEADFAAQETIVDLIRSRFPDHGFLAEEGAGRSSAETSRFAGSSILSTAPPTMFTDSRITRSRSAWNTKAKSSWA